MLPSYIRSLSIRIPLGPVLSGLLGLAGGFFAIREPKLALALVGAGLVVGLFASSPIWIALLVAPASFNVSRLAVGHGIALPDVMLILATLLSIPALSRLGTPTRITYLRRCLAIYVVAMAAIVAVHPSGRALVEAGHRTLLVVGPLGVGAWIYMEGRTRTALRLLTGAAVVVAIACIIVGAAHGFKDPAQPLGLQKNYSGSVLAFASLVLLAAPTEVDLPPYLRYACILIVSGGLAATHSRSAMLGLVLGAFVWLFRTHPDYRKRSFFIGVILAAGFFSYAGYLANQQLVNTSATENTNSVAVRNKTDAATLALWRTSPIVGVGIYYYNDPYYPDQNRFLVAPPNLIYEALAEGGIVLAVGLVAFEAGAIAILWRIRTPLGVAGLALVSARLLQGFFDIYWTAGDASLPWLIAGMGVAQAAAGWKERKPVSGSDDTPAVLQPT